MKRWTIPVVIIALAAAGYFLGRLTAPAVPAAPSAADDLALSDQIPNLPVPPAPEPSDEADSDLVIETPAEEAAASGPFEVAGRARGAAIIRVELTPVNASQGESEGEAAKVVSGQEGALPGGNADAEGAAVWSGETTLSDSGFARFSLMVTPTGDLKGPHLLKITRQPSDGGASETVTRDIVFGVADAVRIKVYFQRAGFGDGDCSVVSPVERLVSSRDSIYRSALEELLKGPTDEERADGLTTTVPIRVSVKSVAADAAGTVTADFNAALDRGVAGSCRVGAIRAQIDNTLRQFPEVRDVIIAVEGNVEEALQP